MLGVYNYTVLLTYFGMLTAFTGVSLALRGDIQGALSYLSDALRRLRYV